MLQRREGMSSNVEDVASDVVQLVWSEPHLAASESKRVDDMNSPRGDRRTFAPV